MTSYSAGQLIKWQIIEFYFIVTFIKIIYGGSCHQSSLCCNGRDSSCVVQSAPLNSIIEDLNDKPCYCDHACLKLGDCCHDFKDYCGVYDCIVSPWGPWSECNTDCGTGIMTRTRIIEKQPQNGGKRCPSLVQKRGCQGYKCSRHHERRVLKEAALLLPASLSKIRHLNDTNDIRKNLRLRYLDSTKYNREKEYCVEYEVIKASKPCHKIAPYNYLSSGERVKVRCDLEALIADNFTNIYQDGINNNEVNKIDYRCRGEGLPGRNNRWSALAVPSCRGKWLRLTLNEPKQCSDSKFIFV